MEQQHAAALSPPTSPTVTTSHSHMARPSTAMRHSRTQSRMGEAASRASDEEGARTAVKVGTSWTTQPSFVFCCFISVTDSFM